MLTLIITFGKALGVANVVRMYFLRFQPFLIPLSFFFIQAYIQPMALLLYSSTTFLDILEKRNMESNFCS